MNSATRSTYHTVYTAALQQYEQPKQLPFFLIESTYENAKGISERV